MTIQIVVQAGLDGKTILIDTEPGDSMASLFQKISDKQGIEKQSIQLVYAGKPYRPGDARIDHQSIEEIGIKDRSLLQLVTRVVGGH